MSKIGERQKIVPFITGPTAVGKTEVAIELAKMLNGEIISVDSRQVYKGLDIGTAKPALRQQKEIPHHLIDILEPDEEISAGLYRELALKTVDEITSRGRLPIFVGGTGLYISAVIKGIFNESYTDKNVRMKIKEELKEKGAEALYLRLSNIDPELASKIHINDVKRIMRALEIYEITGTAPSELYKNQAINSPFPYCIFVLSMNRKELYERIDARVDRMIGDGLIEEVKKLLTAGYRKDLDSLLTLGYREVVTYLDGKCSEDEMIEKIKRNTRKYAKRQLTWFRNQYDAIWIDTTNVSSVKEVAEIIRDIITKK